MVEVTLIPYIPRKRGGKRKVWFPIAGPVELEVATKTSRERQCNRQLEGRTRSLPSPWTAWLYVMDLTL